MPSFGETATNTPDAVPVSARNPPAVAPRSVSLQTWQSSTAPGGDGSRHARSASMDSLESSGSSSSGGNGHRGTPDTIADYIPTRTVGKTPKLPAHNPLQFVKVQSPLYKKAEQQIKQTKEVKVTRETLKEGEEEWQSVCMPTSTDWTFNLDNWKSRRRKVSEKVIQRAEEMRQIEAEEQLRQEQYQQQQRKIKKFSEIVEKRSSSRSYNLDLYIGQGDDSGLGGTPEPDDTIDSHSSILRSDTSEGMTSEAESIDSDIHKSDKLPDKEPPKVPQKPQSRLKKDTSVDEFENIHTSRINFSHQLSRKDLSAFDNFSSTDPSDIEGHGGDNETVSSEEDIPYLSNDHKPVRLIKNLCDSNEDNCLSGQHIIKQENDSTSQVADNQMNDRNMHSFHICIKAGDNRGFGFALKGGKDQRCPPYIDSITKYSAADITGLKEGDLIISLNGEKVTDSSHASIIFSVKQAVYTGVLDLVITRSSEKTSLFPETQTKSSNRKSSFAEKLALFSSGINGPTTNTEEIKCPISLNQTDDNKPKSLVLRRRSAFENGKSENHASHRRSSGLTQESQFIKADNLGKRLSVDFSLSQVNIQENIPSKKGPPPPVPVKPKIKPKTPQDSPTTESEVNGFNKNLENSNFISPNNITVTCSFAENQRNISQPELFLNENEIESGMKDIKLEDENTDNTQNCVSNVLLEKVKSPQKSCAPACDILPTNNHESLDHVVSNVSNNDSLHICQPVIQTDITKEDDVDNISTNCTIYKSDLSDSLLIAPKSEWQNIETACENVPDIADFPKPVSESFITVSFSSTKPLVNDEDQFYSENTQSYSNLNSEVVSSDDLDDTFTNQVDTNLSQNNMFSEVEACDVEDVDVSNINELKSPQEETEYIYTDENSDDFEENINSNIAILEESINRIQINPSPLCLPLEKIDEDDVISASTTTSSETPDTETVIETLPSNLSPLPNDESNGEESSKTSNEIEHITNNPAESSSGNFEMPVADNSNESLETFPQVPNQEVLTHNISELNVNNGYAYTEDQDEEYCRELDESLDQITSLDVIDEIEQRLMHQLEQQGDTFEEMDEGLTAQLASDINKQWLYFTEETELLDDLTPRNLEPPSEPPPPPPSFELDSSMEKLAPMTRANSTKRIKKELWRRRSDFLGLDSPEGIDVDNILHPPPGLEEILKQEREQNQWLEKRLSLAENDLSAPLYMSEAVTLESQNYNQSDYSECFVEENSSPVDSPPEDWKENLDEECKYDSSCDLQYVPAADVPSPASEDAPKIGESPQRKAKQNIHNLGAAPKAKIMDSNKWITEKVIPVNKKSIEPVFHQNTYNQNYWLAQDDERKKVQTAENTPDRRFSMPHFANHHPDVTIRTWGDREYEFQKQRPKSAVWNSTANDSDLYNPYSQPPRQDFLRSHSLDGRRENCDTDTLESEVHNCSCCGKGLCEGSAMGIEALRLYFHIECFRCCMCRIQLGNGSCGTDVQVKNNRLYCPSCFTVD